MSSHLNVVVIGSCLSNIPALFLTNEYGFKRLNNTSIGRTDLFIKRFIEEISDLPPIEEFRRMLDIPDDDSKGVMRYLLENYRDLAGMTEIDPSLPTLITNLKSAPIDVFLLDNLNDVWSRLLVWEPNGQNYKFNFSDQYAGKNSKIHGNCHYDQLISTEESVENWSKIVPYLRSFQPNAKIIFSATHSCTSQDVPERAERASHFYEMFSPVAKKLDIQLIPPLNLSSELTKGSDDWAHFDMKVYKALAGYIYTSIVSGWTPSAVSSEKIILANTSVLPKWISPPALLPSIARILDIDVSRVSEESCMDSTENWDSLRQVDVMTEVEKCFGVTVSFDETMNTNSILHIRNLLARSGVVAYDDPSKSENLFSRFVDRGRRYPDAKFMKLISSNVEKEFTYGEMLSQVSSMRNRLRSIPKDKIVVIILDHSIHIYSGFMGCILNGSIPTILPPLTRKQDPKIFKESLEVLFQRLQPTAVITSQNLINLIPTNIVDDVIMVDTIELDTYNDARLSFDDFTYTVPRGGVAFLQHSSGTTGHKKGVMLTHDQVYEQIRIYSKSINISTGDKICSWLPLYHDMGLITSFIMPLVIGCPIISIDALEWVVQPTTILDQIEIERVNFTWLPNFAFHHILKSVRETQSWDLSSVKAIISCSEPCRTASFEAFAQKFSPMGCGLEKLQTSYAMAENVFAVTQSTVGQAVKVGQGELSPYLSSGKPLPGVEIQIRRDKNSLDENDVGEIWFRSTSMFRGYYNLEELTSERVVDHWYATRDLGRMSEGELFVKGRVDDIIIISGKNVVAHELEDELNMVSGIAPGRILVGSRYSNANSSEEMFILAEPLDEGTSHLELEKTIREKAFSLCGVSPRKVHILQKGFLIKSTSGKISRASSIAKFDKIEAESSTSFDH